MKNKKPTLPQAVDALVLLLQSSDALHKAQPGLERAQRELATWFRVELIPAPETEAALALIPCERLRRALATCEVFAGDPAAGSAQARTVSRRPGRSSRKLEVVK